MTHGPLLEPVIDDLRDVREMRTTCEMQETCEKKRRAQDNMKIIYRHFAIRLFSRTVILFLIARENPFVSCIITASTARWFERRDKRNLSLEAA